MNISTLPYLFTFFRLKLFSRKIYQLCTFLELCTILHCHLCTFPELCTFFKKMYRVESIPSMIYESQLIWKQHCMKINKRRISLICVYNISEEFCVCVKCAVLSRCDWRQRVIRRRRQKHPHPGMCPRRPSDSTRSGA